MKKILLLSILIMFCMVSVSGFAEVEYVTNLTVTTTGGNMTDPTNTYDNQPPYPASAAGQATYGNHSYWLTESPVHHQNNIFYINFTGIANNASLVYFNMNISDNVSSNRSSGYQGLFRLECWNSTDWIENYDLRDPRTASAVYIQTDGCTNYTMCSGAIDKGFDLYNSSCVLNDSFGVLPLRIWTEAITFGDSTNYTFHLYDFFINYTQVIDWSIPQANISSGLSGDGVKLNATFTIEDDSTLYNVSVVFNNTYYTPTKTGNLYELETTLPMTETATDIDYYFVGNVLLANGTSYYIQSETSSVEATPIELTSCGSGVGVIQFKYRDEENPYEQINNTMEIAITYWTNNQLVNITKNFTFPANISADGLHEICISPATASVYAYSIQEYWNDTGDATGESWPSRNYYLSNAHLTNTTSVVYLYSLNETLASVVGISVQDTYSDPVDNVIMKIQRYYIGENTYRTVAMVQTDTDGDAVTRLRLSTGDDDVFYRFILEKDWSVIETVEMTKVIQTSLLFTVSLEGLSEYWEYWNNLAYSCNFNNATQILSCEWSDTSGLMTEAVLRVEELLLAGYSLKCDDTSTDTAGALICDLSGMTTETYQFWLEFTMGDTIYTAVSGIIANTQGQLYGLSGVMAGFFLVMILGFIGLQFGSPEIAILLSIMGVIAIYMIGLITLGIGALFGLIIAAALLIYKVGS